MLVSNYFRAFNEMLIFNPVDVTALLLNALLRRR